MNISLVPNNGSKLFQNKTGQTDSLDLLGFLKLTSLRLLEIEKWFKFFLKLA